MPACSAELLASRHRLPDVSALIKKRWKQIDTETVARVRVRERALARPTCVHDETVFRDSIPKNISKSNSLTRLLPFFSVDKQSP